MNTCLEPEIHKITKSQPLYNENNPSEDMKNKIGDQCNPDVQDCGPDVSCGPNDCGPNHD